jgi:hypothetical protein
MRKRKFGLGKVLAVAIAIVTFINESISLVEKVLSIFNIAPYYYFQRLSLLNG